MCKSTTTGKMTGDNEIQSIPITETYYNQLILFIFFTFKEIKASNRRFQLWQKTVQKAIIVSEKTKAYFFIISFQVILNYCQHFMIFVKEMSKNIL